MVNLKENGITELSSDQLSGKVQYERESFLVRNRSEKVDVFLGYRRGLDFDAENKPGQDFAAVWSDDGGYIVGVVADGVSESFYGHLAAYHLSEPLLKVLWRMRERPPSEDELERGLKELEKRVATEVIENYPVPDNLGSFLKESLEDKRPKGSQAVFSAFVLDASKSQLRLYQVGDVDAIVHYPDKYPELIQAPPKGRWSSAGKSQMRLKSSTIEGVTGIMIKSDGTGKGWGEGWGKSLKDRALNEGTFNILAAKRAGIDDLSFIAVRWGEVLEAPETEIEEPRSTGPSPPRGDGKGVLPGTSPYDPHRGSREEERGRGVPDPPRETEVLRGTRAYNPPRNGSGEVIGGRGRRTTSRPLNRLGVGALLAAGAVAGVLMALLIAVFLIGGDAPEVQDDSYSIGVGETLSVPAPGVLGNDAEDDDDVTLGVVDAKPETRRINPVDRPSNGEVLLNPDGSFAYIPNPGFSGEDSFTYRASDGRNESDVATVTITVTAAPVVNNPLEANNDNNYNTGVNETLRIEAANGVLANDTGDQRTAALVDGPPNGMLETNPDGSLLNPDGSFTYTPNQDYTGTDFFTYKASDGTNESNVVTVTIMVTAAGDTPKAQSQQEPNDQLRQRPNDQPRRQGILSRKGA